MNSVRIKDRLQRAWLRVVKSPSPRDGHSVLRGEMFDYTPFEFTVPDHEYEEQLDGSLLVEVGLVGHVGNVPTSGIMEIVLPYPVLSHGHNVRVKETSLVKWETYYKLQELKNKEKK